MSLATAPPSQSPICFSRFLWVLACWVHKVTLPVCCTPCHGTAASMLSPGKEGIPFVQGKQHWLRYLRKICEKNVGICGLHAPQEAREGVCFFILELRTSMIICMLTCFFLDLILEDITKAWDLFNHLLIFSFTISPNNFPLPCSVKLIPKIFILADSKMKQCSWHLSQISGLKNYKKQIWLSVPSTIWDVFSVLCDTSSLVSKAFQLTSNYQEPSYICNVF